MAGHKKRNGGMCGNPHCGPKRKNPSLNVRNPSRKVNTGSEDYRLGLFQGAMEKGKLPPPHDTSADFKRGYADGAKVAAARPAASAESLGVYKATGSQPQAGAVLYDAVKGEAVATLRNPSINVRNPSGAKSEGLVQKFTNVFGQTGWLVYDRHGHRVGFYATKPLALEMLAFANSKRHSTSSVVSGPTRNPSLNVRNPSGAKQRARGTRSFGMYWDPDAYDNLALERAAHARKQIAKAKKAGAKAGRGSMYEFFRQGHAQDIEESKRARPKLPNPMSASERKHLAHEKGEEKAFASMMAALAEGVTVKVGAHRIRKLSKGYVVVDGERLTTTQAAAKLHRGK